VSGANDYVGYAKILAGHRIEQQQNKPLLGKPYLKYGQCYGLFGYFMQLGCVLGAVHGDKPDSFGEAFLGLHGPPGGVQQFFEEAVEEHVLDRITGEDTIGDYVTSEQINRFKYPGNRDRFLLEFGNQKVPVDVAMEGAWQFAEQGAMLGAMYPDVAKGLYERTHAPQDPEMWEKARRAGLDLPEKQDLISFAEYFEGENELFMEYCKSVCPHHYERLSQSQV
jgi:hypothetical protein